MPAIDRAISEALVNNNRDKRKPEITVPPRLRPTARAPTGRACGGMLSTGAARVQAQRPRFGEIAAARCPKNTILPRNREDRARLQHLQYLSTMFCCRRAE